MHVPPQVLLPRMQHQRERGGPAQPARVGREPGERRRDRGEEHLVERPWTLPDESIQIVRQGEHEVKVRHRQHLAPARGQPGFLGSRLAARAMAIAAGDDGAPRLRLGNRQRMCCEIRRAVTPQYLGQALAHPEAHAIGRALDVTQLQGADLGHAKPRGVGGGE